MTKLFRDPLYNYVTVDPSEDAWLLPVINSRELQRLRRIRQLGVSNFTYPGAEHTRLCHTLGVLHLMQAVITHLDRHTSGSTVRDKRAVLLAAAVCHDVGHGPFSHLFEPCLGIDHEVWSRRILTNPDTEIHQALAGEDPALPGLVATLIDEEDTSQPLWQKSLISSQLDVDRMDYLRRDSLFTGAGYGHFDWRRLVESMRMHGDKPKDWEIVWDSKAKLSIEEYIFSRFYMYQNVYLHKTTRGFEQMLQAMWRRARQRFDDGWDAGLVPEIRGFWNADAKGGASVRQYLTLEEHVVLRQIEVWTQSGDSGLGALATAFRDRIPLAVIDPPAGDAGIAEVDGWHEALRSLVRDKGYDPDCFCLRDEMKPKYHSPYIPERERKEQTGQNAIRICDGGEPQEISEALARLRAVTTGETQLSRYYVPRDVREEAVKLRERF